MLGRQWYILQCAVPKAPYSLCRLGEGAGSDSDLSLLSMRYENDDRVIQ